MNRKQFAVLFEGQNSGPVTLFDTLDEAKEHARLVAHNRKTPVMVVKPIFVASPKVEVSEEDIA